MSGIFIRFIRRLIVSIQEILPKRVLSKLVQKVAESETRIVKNTLIKLILMKQLALIFQVSKRLITFLPGS